MATSLRTKRCIFDLNRIILSMLNKASNFDHKYDISFSPIQYIHIHILFVCVEFEDLFIKFFDGNYVLFENELVSINSQIFLIVEEPK